VIHAPCRAEDAVAPARPLEADEVLRLEPVKLKELTVAAQDRIEITAKLDGVLVAAISISPAGEQRVRTMTLEGRVRDPAQRALVAKVVSNTLQSISFWSTSDDEFIVNAEKLAVTEPSVEIGGRSLARALDEFFAGRHAEADVLLSHALAESPRQEVIHYWKVANFLAMKRTDRAEQRLEVLTRRNPTGSDAYAAQLQRLQGQYRREIIELEHKMMLKNR
jgi:hypothetical protein